MLIDRGRDGVLLCNFLDTGLVAALLLSKFLPVADNIVAGYRCLGSMTISDVQHRTCVISF
jgi:hypothetical protein